MDKSNSAALNLIASLAFALNLAISSSAFASEEVEIKYSKKGADTCLKCHDEDNEYPVLPIFKTKHGEINDDRSPMARLECETCHGPGDAHQKRTKRNEPKAPIGAFGSKAWTPIEQQNQVCLNCHNDTQLNYWHGNTHESSSVGCADCHQVHARRDPMLNAKSQVDKCAQCHQTQKVEFNQRSSHPVRSAKMSCSDCHNPHGTFNDKLIKTATKNQLCFLCHAEKRGPLLWSHAPVTEDCSLCHSPHGSIYINLLVKRPPLLCQQCHSQAGHSATLYSGNGLPGGSDTFQRKFLLGRGCLNCHSQVHGSNHPSGVKLLR